MVTRKLRFAVRPAGTTDAPSLWPADPADPGFLAPREDVRLTCLIDWAWVRDAIDSGYAVSVIVDSPDVRALIDTVQSQLGFEIGIKITDEDVLWVFRPEAVGPNE